MKRYITYVIMFYLMMLFACSFIFAEDSKNLNTMHVGVVVNTHNNLIDMSEILTEDLKKYCTTFFIETDDERSYINAMIPRRNLRKSYLDYTSLVSSSKSPDILQKESVFLDNEKLYKSTLEYFPPNKKDGIKEYVVAPRESYFSEFVFKDRIPIDYERFESKKFDERALFEESHIVAKLIALENDYDILVIPSSIILSSTLIRLRLKVYNLMEDKFYTIYDKIIPTVDIEAETDSWVLLLAENLSSNNFALFTVQPKDYAVAVEIDGESVSNSGVLLFGEHKVLISSPGRISSEFVMNFEDGKINVINFELYKHEYKNLFVNTSTSVNSIINIDGNDYLLPRHFDKFETPLNYKISSPGFISLTNSITVGKDNMNYIVDLRPEWTSDKDFVSTQMKKFYTAVTVTLGLFAIDIGTKSFGRTGNKQEMWSSLNDMSKGIIYASLGFVFGSIVDYFIASKYSLY